MANPMIEEIRHQQQKLFQNDLQMQPRVVIVGNVIKPTVSYVVADDATGLMNTPTKAIHVWFKSVQVL